MGDAGKEEHSLVKTLSMPDHGGEDKGENIGQHKVQDQQNQNVRVTLTHVRFGDGIKMIFG